MTKHIKLSWLFSFFELFKNKKLKYGDRVKLYDGYDKPPVWLNGKEACYGEVVGFIRGPYKKDDAIVKLDEELSFNDIKGKVMILTLRFQGTFWGKSEIVHLHLLDTIPNDNEWCDIDKSEWDRTHIESHATYKIIQR